MSKPTDKLTQQAVKQHDKIHPTYKATTSSPATSKQKEHLNIGKTDEGVPRRRSRVQSTSESVTSRSPVRVKPGLTIFRVVAATRTWQRLAKRNSARNSKPKQKLENTYRLEPKDGEKFQTDKVNKLLQDILESRLQDAPYDPITCKKLSTDLSAIIKVRVKSLGFPRYKFVCNVTIMEKLGQGMQVASRCVWNADSDSFSTYTFTNTNLIAIAYVHAVYFE